MELVAGLGWTDTARSLDMALRVHGLAADATDERSEWGVSGSLRLAAGDLGRGLMVSLTPSHGTAPVGAERLWLLPDASALAVPGDAPLSGRLDAAIGYGLALPGGFTGTPNVGFGVSGGGARDWRVGWRVGVAGLSLDLDAVRSEPAAGAEPVEHAIGLRSALRW